MVLQIHLIIILPTYSNDGFVKNIEILQYNLAII